MGKKRKKPTATAPAAPVTWLPPGWLVVVPLLVLLAPFAAVRFVPITDLPQHLDQVRMFFDVLGGRGENLYVSWGSPNNLVYAVASMFWALFPPLAAGRATTAALVAAWIVLPFAIARVENRPYEAAILASVVALNLNVYWGFLNFLAGWPVFVMWVLLTRERVDRNRWLLLVGVSLLLYLGHALWFAMGALWLVLSVVLFRTDLRTSALRLSAIVPVGLLAALWYPSMARGRASGGFDVSARWEIGVFERLSPGFIVDSTLGGLHGWVEPLVVATLVLWIGAVLATNWGHVMARSDRRLLACAGLLAACWLFAPDRFLNTIFFAQRWFPCAVALLLMGLPAPRFDRRLLTAFAMIVIALLGGATVSAWRSFERVELEGLHDSLVRLQGEKPPAGEGRVLGLDFVQESPTIKARPYLQLYAYAGPLAARELNFSFAEHDSGLVRYVVPRDKGWRKGLAWNAMAARNEDLAHFDAVLVHAEPDFHDQFAQFSRMTSRTQTARWRLYERPPTAGP